MGLGGISPIQLIIILLIVVMLFGTKKLRNLGSDLGGAFKGFKNAMKDDDAKNDTDDQNDLNDKNDQIAGMNQETGETIDATTKKVEEN